MYSCFAKSPFAQKINALLKDLALKVGFLLRLRPNPVQQSVFSFENHCDHFCYYLMECVMLLS